MNNLTNIIEGIVFASGDAVPVRYIVEKLGCTVKEVNACIDKLKEKYVICSTIMEIINLYQPICSHTCPPSIPVSLRHIL